MTRMSDTNPVSRRDFLKTVTAAGAGLGLGGLMAAKSADAADVPPATPPQAGKSVMDLRVPKMDRVRVAFIGVGARGSGHVGTLMSLEGVDVTAICDNHQPSLDRAVNNVVKHNRPKPAAFGGDDY